MENRKLHFTITPLHQKAELARAKLKPASRRPYFELLFVTNDAGSLQVNHREFVLNRNSVFLILPGQLRSCALSDVASGYYMSFSEDILTPGASRFSYRYWCAVLERLLDVWVVSSDGDFHSEVEVLLKKIAREGGGIGEIAYDDIAVVLINVLVFDLSKRLPSGLVGLMGGRGRDLCRTFIELVEIEYLSHKQVKYYASLLFVSPGHLNRVVRRLTGRTAKEIIEQQLISEAKRVLTSNVSMKETAYRLGFTDLGQFSKFFKRNAGVCFKVYRDSGTWTKAV